MPKSKPAQEPPKSLSDETQPDAAWLGILQQSAGVEAILDVLPIGVFILDAELRVAHVNSRIEYFFGVPRSIMRHADKRYLVEEHIHMIFDRGDEFKARILATYDHNNYTEEFSCHILPGEGRSERWLEHRSQPIMEGVYAGGRVETYVDVTDRVRAEDEINWISNQFLQIQEREKERIAGNLHDEVGQSVIALKFMAEGLRDSLCDRDVLLPEEEGQLTVILQQIRSISTEISQLSSDLMPSILQPLGITETVTWLCNSYTDLYGIRIDYKSYGLSRRRLPRNVEIALYRIYQEALNNVIKHAQARNVELRLIYTHPRVIARIVDDGRGFNREELRLGTGLRIMRRRIEELDGRFRIDATPGQGTVLRVEIPCELLETTS